MTLLTFGKHKNELLETAPAGYVKWLAAHKKVLSVEHRHFSDKAKELLERREKEAQATAIAASKLGHMESLAKNGSFLAQMDLQMTKFIADQKIAEHLVKTPPKVDLGLKGNLSSNIGFQLMR